MIAAIISGVVILLKFTYEIFQLWREKDAANIQLRKEALYEGIEALAQSKFENADEDRRRVTAAFARNKRLRK